MTAQTEKNKIFTDILKHHGGLLGQMTGKIAALTNDVHALEETTRSVEAHLAKNYRDPKKDSSQV